jgi:membrane protease YdiL (CAAX protease family)
VIPIGEELFFRGLGVRVLRFLGGAAAVVGTAVIFALGHAVFGAIPPLLLFGLGLGWVRLRSESVWPGVAAHGVYNGLGVLITYATLQ